MTEAPRVGERAREAAAEIIRPLGDSALADAHRWRATEIIQAAIDAELREMTGGQSFYAYDALRARLARAEAALRGLVGCIAESAADRGPPVTRGSPMAQVCKVLQRTGQYDAALAALAALAQSEGPGP